MTRINIALEGEGVTFLLNQTKCANCFSMIVAQPELLQKLTAQQELLQKLTAQQELLQKTHSSAKC